MRFDFSIFFKPHGWYPRHDTFKFFGRAYYSTRWKSPAVRKYIERRWSESLCFWQKELERLHKASGRFPVKLNSHIACSINHLKDDDVAYRSDSCAEIAASVVL